MEFILFISFVTLLRLAELVYSRRNEAWLLRQGAVEYGQKHYPFIITLHTVFFISLVAEYSILPTQSFYPGMLVLYFVLLACKVWVVGSLGKFWNTKIYRVQGFPLIKKGPYKYFSHPNYLIVVAEIVIIPLVSGLYYTAMVFTILNLLMLFVRIKVENKALGI